jgi:thioredoxin 1
MPRIQSFICSSSSVSEAVLEITDSNYRELVAEHPGPMLLDVWASWCGPCRLIAPVITWVASEYEGRLRVGKADCDANPVLVESLAVKGLPTLVLFRDGSEIRRHEGVLTQAQLIAFLDAHL